MPKTATTQSSAPRTKRAAASKSTKAATKRATKATTKSTKSRATTKKAAAKKGTTKTRTTAAKNTMIVANPEQAFWVSDGSVLHSLADLAAALPVMSDAIYTQHVNRDKNDFAAWIELVLGEPELAATVRRARTRKTATSAIEKRVKQLTK